jgi:hypothetical protein
MLQNAMGTISGRPKWIKPQLTRLVDEAPAGNDWLHLFKDGAMKSSPTPHISRPSKRLFRLVVFFYP